MLKSIKNWILCNIFNKHFSFIFCTSEEWIGQSGRLYKATRIYKCVHCDRVSPNEIEIIENYTEPRNIFENEKEKESIQKD